MRKLHYGVFLSCAALLMSCSDDGSSDRDDSACRVTETVCDNNQVMVCEEGKAPKYQACGEDEVCLDGVCEPKDACSEDGVSCRDERTLVRCVKGKMPTNKACGEDEVCLDGACLSKDACSEDGVSCRDEQTLVRCEKGKQAVVEHCAEADSKGFCDSDEKACRIPVTVNVGEACDRANICAEGLVCNETTHVCTWPSGGVG